MDRYWRRLVKLKAIYALSHKKYVKAFAKEEYFESMWQCIQTQRIGDNGMALAIQIYNSKICRHSA